MDKRDTKEKKEKLRTQKRRGFVIVGICVLSVVLCNTVPILRGSDLTGICIILPIGLALIFSKDILIY